MAQFASDGFAGASGTDLSAHDSSWVRHSGSAISSVLIDGRVRGNGSGVSLYYHSGQPASADYAVSADIHEMSDAAYGAGVVARCHPAEQTYYMARWYTSDHPDSVQLYKFVSGVATLLGNPAYDLETGTSASIRLECVGNQLKVYLRGSGTAAISVTDDSIPAAGHAGIRMGYAGCAPASDTTCLHLDNFRAADVVTHVDPAPAAAIQATGSSVAAIVQGHVLAATGAAQAGMSGDAAVSRGLALSGTPSGQHGGSMAEAITQTHLLAGMGTVQAVASSSAAMESAAAGTLRIVVSMQINASITAAVTQMHLLEGAHAAGRVAGGVGAIQRGTGALAAAPCVQVEHCEALPVSQIGIIQEPPGHGDAATRGKKPGVPGGTPEWLKTTLEILTGRRGNRISIPGFQHLSFSDTPTRTECEALYRYTNTVRQAVEEIVSRLDS